MLDEREFELRKSDIKDYKIKYLIEDRIQLDIEKSDGEKLEYKINTNPENPDISIVEKELKDGFDKLLLSDSSVIKIWEQNYRKYLYITFPDGKIKRYSMLGFL